MRLVGSELLKVWTAPRTLIGIVLAELAIVGFATASVIDSWQSESDFGPRPDLERGLVGDALALLLMLIIAELWVGEDFNFGGQEWRFVARLALATAVVAVLGFEVGACTRRQLGAIIVFFVWFAFVEPAAEHLWSSGREYLPLHAVGGLLGTTGSTFPSFGRAALETAVYLVALGAAAVAITRRRDIT